LLACRDGGFPFAEEVGRDRPEDHAQPPEKKPPEPAEHAEEKSPQITQNTQNLPK